MFKCVAIALVLMCGVAIAQAPAPPKAPPAVGTTSGAFCDMTGIVDASVTMNGVEYDAGYSYGFTPAIPKADVADNHTKWTKVLDVASQEQDKGGPYELEISEYRSCEGGGAIKVSDGSALIKGVTLAGLTRIGDEALKQSKAINDRTKARSKNQNSVDHDHTRAKKVKRDDLQRKVRD